MNIRLRNGMTVGRAAMASAIVSLTRNMDFGVLLVRNVGPRAINVQLLLDATGDVNSSIAVSYRLASIAAAMAAKHHWKKIRVFEDTNGDEVVFRFCHISHSVHTGQELWYELPLLCSLDQLLADHTMLSSMGLLPVLGEHQGDDPYIEMLNEHGFPQLVTREDHQPVCYDCKACVMPNRGQGMICDSCDHEFSLHCEHDRYH